MHIVSLSPGGPIPHNMAKTFDGPPTLERSGSEHRVGRLHPSFLRREGLVRMWSSLWKGRRRDSKKYLLYWEKAMPVSAMKARFQIAECSSLYQQGRTG